MYAVDFFWEKDVHIEAKTKKQLCNDVHDFFRLFIWPVSEVRVANEPHLGGEYVEIVPVSEDNGPCAFEIKKV